MCSTLRPAQALAIILSAVSSVNAGSLTTVAPPGPYFKLTPAAHEKTETFKLGKPVIGTTYFYWYDVYSGAHLRNPDGTDALTTHPPQSDMDDLSYKSPNWHYSQLRDVSRAGIDFIMPVYWGVPGAYDDWSVTGLTPLVTAHQRMIAEREKEPSKPLPPKIGMFYDTSTLLQTSSRVKGFATKGRIDLTTARGQEWFYVTIRDFFSMVPPDKWARMDGRPIVFLYNRFGANVDETLLGVVRKRFESDFGTGLFLVRHTDWPMSSDAWYEWGGAIKLTIGDYVAGLGPGYDHSAVPGREPRVVDRQQGRFYQSQWEKMLRMERSRRPWIVHVETWNEWHEGTDIARSAEYGDRYIQATAKYAKMFHAGVRLERSGPFFAAERVRWSGRAIGGLYLKPSRGDGQWTYREIDGERTVATVGDTENSQAHYLYFDIDDSYVYDEMNRVARVTVTFRDDGRCNSFRIQYDSGDGVTGPGRPFQGSRPIAVGNTGTWRTVIVDLPNVRFCNRTNGCDFRLAADGGTRDLIIREVIVRLVPGVLADTTNQETSTR